MKIDLQPVSSVEDAFEALAVLELRASFHSAVFVGDLEYDDDLISQSYIARLPEKADRERLAAEPGLALSEAKENFLQSLYQEIENRKAILAQNYPFVSDVRSGLLLEAKSRETLTGAGVAYFWLSLFTLLRSDKDYIVIDDDDLDEFEKIFRKVFEYISCYVAAARSPSQIWYLGDSRSVNDFLDRMLRVVEICGTGVVKTFPQLGPHQTGANDAGVDVLAVSKDRGLIGPDATALLIGATTQTSQRRNKVMGMAQLNRFLAYFNTPPLLVYVGVMIVPFDRSEGDAYMCGENNCLYISRETIFRDLGRFIANDVDASIRVPGIKLLKQSASLLRRMRLASNGSDLGSVWAS